MPLTKWDEYPAHQLVTTMDHAGTSDPRWTDGWGGHVLYDPDGKLCFVSGMSLYPNLDVIDGYVCVIVDGKHHNFRMSRRLRPDVESLNVGPLHWEIVEPMKTIRMVLDKNETGMECDMVWEGIAPPYEEPPHFRRANGRVLEDYIRVTQIGKGIGTVKVAGKSYKLDGVNCLGQRTRRWGIRNNVGGPEHAIAFRPAGGGVGIGQVYWAVLQAGPYWVYWSSSEDAEGRFLAFDGIIGHLYGDDRPVIKLKGMEQNLEIYPGSHGRLKKAELTFVDVTGRKWPCQLETISPGWDFKGWGYGNAWKDSRGLGAPRGDYHEESDVWDVSDPEAIIDDETGKRWATPMREFLARAIFEGVEGRADISHMVGPKYKPMGFV